MEQEKRITTYEQQNVPKGDVKLLTPKQRKRVLKKLRRDERVAK